jgi:hypothetical protein
MRGVAERKKALPLHAGRQIWPALDVAAVKYGTGSVEENQFF